MKKIWPFTFYFLYFSAFAALLPFFVLFYQGLGFSGAQIGLLTGVPPLITLIGAPFGTGLADSTGRHKLIMSVGLASCNCCSAPASLFHEFCSNFYSHRSVQYIYISDWFFN